MSIFDLRQSVIDEYSKYVQSFLSIADDRIRAFIEESLLKNQALWPDALLQLNPSYEMASTIQDVVKTWAIGLLLSVTIRILKIRFADTLFCLANSLTLSPLHRPLPSLEKGGVG
jgi:hypothetical protein